MASSSDPAPRRRQVGRIEVTAIADGEVTVGMETLRNVAPETVAELVGGEGERPAAKVSILVFALRTAGRLLLVDTGAGTAMGADAGRLAAGLAAAGIDPAQVDTILFTHLHPDHSNGLTDDAGRAVFASAEVRVHEREWSHWFDDDRMAAASPGRRKHYFEAPRRQLAPYRDRVRTFRAGELAPGVFVEPLFGHTPGHCGFRLVSGGERLLIWGDIVHVPEVQVPHPQATVAMDEDPEAAIRCRRDILATAAAEDLTVAGMHLRHPGFARIARDGSGYRLLPAEGDG